MNAKNEKRSSAIDEEAFFRAIFDNLSPDAVATAIVALRAAAVASNSAQDRVISAYRGIQWLADTLEEMMGAEQYQRLVEELRL